MGMIQAWSVLLNRKWHTVYIPFEGEWRCFVTKCGKSVLASPCQPILLAEIDATGAVKIGKVSKKTLLPYMTLKKALEWRNEYGLKRWWHTPFMLEQYKRSHPMLYEGTEPCSECPSVVAWEAPEVKISPPPVPHRQPVEICCQH
jgi:hypothetical protein